MKAFTSVFGTSWLQGRRLLPLMTAYAAEVKGDVLDLGCGESPLRPIFAGTHRFIRMDRYAVDPEVVVIDDPRSLPLDSSSVDAVLMSRMLGDLPDPAGVFQELSRILTPNGKILIYESISYPQHDLPHDYWRVLPAGLGHLAEGVGLKVAEVEYLGGYFTQFALHWNMFIVGNLTRIPALQPVARIATAGCNLVCATLDRLLPRPTLATDYFACVIKKGAADKGVSSE